MKQATQFDADFSGTQQLQIKPRKKFDEAVFTPRELRVMSELAEIYQEATATQMSEVSHLAGQPWHLVFEVEKHPQSMIPYELALDGQPGSITREVAEMIAEEAREANEFLK